MAEFGPFHRNFTPHDGRPPDRPSDHGAQRAVPAAEVVPALQGLVNAVVEAAEMGKAISCRKGCGACCRQLVPVSRTEGERLLQVVEAMPAERRETLRQGSRRPRRRSRRRG